MSEVTLVSNPPLVQRLNQLIDEMAQIGDDQRLCGRDDSRLLQWEDDDHVYLEMSFAGSPELAADISIWDGRVVIRVAR